MFYIVFLIFHLFQNYQCFSTSNPIWKTSIYFRASQQNVINTYTGNDKTPNYTFIFSSPLTGLPNIAYGVGKYQGDDFMMQQYFQIYRIGLTSSSFSVAVQITGVTNLWILCVPYLAIQPSFPHHLNTFDNIPVNYSYGQLINITERSTAVTTFTNTINYTQQCGGRKYNQFQLPISKYKMFLLITSFFVSTTSSTTPDYPLKLKIETKILTTDSYYIKVNLLTMTMVTRLHFSQIVFDQTDVASSNKYKLVYQLWQVDTNGGYKEVPKQFFDNFIMGLSQFQTVTGRCGFEYVWSWVENATFFGVYIQPSITRKNFCGFNLMISTVLYIKTWQCLAPYYYYNATTQLCQDGCGLYTFDYSQQLQIQTSYSCKSCSWGCSKCNNTHCLECNNDDMRMFNGSCYCPNGYLDTLVVTKCQKCQDPDCLICVNNTNYKQSPTPSDPITSSLKNLCTLCKSGYLPNVTTSGCDPIAKCNMSNNELLNYQTNTCQECNLTGCLQCKQTLQLNFGGAITDIYQIGTSKRNLQSNSLGVVSCTVCDQSKQYFKNLTSKDCQLCTLTECVVCSSLLSCQTCNNSNQYFVNPSSRTCQKCSLQGCINCQNLTHCRVCNNTKGYFLNSSSKSCIYCGLGCDDCNLTGRNILCNTCASGLTLYYDVCTCDKGKYVAEANNSISCQLCDSKCRTCNKLSTQCTSCYFEQFRILEQASKSCQCDPKNYIENGGSDICQKVNSSLCDMGYYKNVTTNICTQICGDGIRIDYDCDDGNNQNYDGCSSTCNLQANFTCTNDRYELSECNYVGNVWIDWYSIMKDPFDNVLIFKFNLNPILALYQWLNWIDRLQFTNNIKITITQASMLNISTLQIKAKYFQNIKNKNISLSFIQQINSSSMLISSPINQNIQNSFYVNNSHQHQQPQFTGTRNRLLQSPSYNISLANLTFHFQDLSIDVSQTQNKLDVVYYPDQTYRTVSMFQIVFQVIIIIYLVMVFISLIFFKRILPTLLTFLQLQLCFVSLSSIENVQPQTFSIIYTFNQILGLNNLDKYFSQFCSNGSIQYKFKNLGFSYCFLQNLNLMFLLEIFIILSILVSSLLGMKWGRIKKISKSLKRSFSNVVFFNLINTIGSISLIASNLLNDTTNLIMAIFQLFFTFISTYFIFKYPKIHYIQIQYSDFLKDKKLKGQDNYADQKLSNQLNQKKSNQQLLGGEQRQKKHKSKHKQSEKHMNLQVLMFILFLLSYGVICPFLFTILESKQIIISNLVMIGLSAILIVVQIIMNPFQSKNNLKQSFKQIKINYYATYIFISLFACINIIFGQIQKKLSSDIELKIVYMEYMSYIQISLFLLMMLHMIFAWSYSAYLSFFQDQIYQKYIIKAIAETQKIIHKKQQDRLKRKRSLFSYASSSKINDRSTDVTSQIQINNKNIQNLVLSPNYNRNLIFEIDQLSNDQNRF